MAIRKVQQGFTAGELAPSMYGRFDDAKFAQGLARCRNFIVAPQGPAMARPGTAFVNKAKYSDKRVRIIPFTFSVTETMALEFGDKYIRFHTNGKTLLTSGGETAALSEDDEPYEVETPYEADDLFDIHYVQSMDVMTLVHPSYPPKELRRYGATDWRLVDIDFGAPINPPNAPTCTFAVVASSGVNITDEEKNRYDLKYKVTAVAETDTGDQESVASAVGQCKGNLYLNNATVTITWSGVSGATRYRVYKNYKGLYCFIGETTDTTFIDDNYDPDAGITPPYYDDPFLQSGGILSVDVLSGGTGYQNIVNGIGDDPGNLVYKNYYIGEHVQYAADTHNPTNIVPRGGDTMPYDVKVVDAMGLGSGAEVQLNMGPDSDGSIKYSNGDYEYTEPITQASLQSYTVVKSGSGYSKPQLEFTTRAFTRHLSKPFNGYRWGRRFWRVDLPLLESGVTVKVSDSTGYGAELVASVGSNGAITGVNVRQSGMNYTAPTATVIRNRGSGTNASLKLNVGNGGDYPGSVCYFEQRRCFAGTETRPQMVWMTRTSTENDMSYTLPVQDDNRVKFRIAAQEASRILHLVPLQQLVVLTNSTEYRVSSGSSSPIAPDAIDSKVQAQIGASNVQPVIVNSTLVYPAARGGHLRELGYNYQAGGYVTGDLSLRAAHLFEGVEVRDMTLQKAPDPIVWSCMSDGSLVGLTYLPEQAIGGWHKHTTEGGFFESVAAVPEGEEDVLYVVVRREVGGETVRYIERMHEQKFSELSTTWRVDCGGEYAGPETTTVSGLSWLEGMEVSILANGCVLPNQVVQNGTVKLVNPATRVIVGIPITSEFQTLPLAIQLSDGSYGTGHRKNINQIWVRVDQSSSLLAGPDFENLTETRPRFDEDYGSPPDLVDGTRTAVLHPRWNDEGQLCIRQTNPLPLKVVSIAYDLAE